MFDWKNEEELTNIIWGEASDNEDHIVPYPKGSEEKRLVASGGQQRKEFKRDYDTFKALQEVDGDKNDFNGRQPDTISHFDSNEGVPTSVLGTESWLGLSLKNSSRNDQDLERIELSSNMDETEKLDSSKALALEASLEKDHDIFRDRLDDREDGDFVDSSWANIGSFDDLARIFSIKDNWRYKNMILSIYATSYVTWTRGRMSGTVIFCSSDDPFLGHVSLDNADEPWSTSKGFGGSPEKSFPSSAESSLFLSETSQNAQQQSETERSYVQHANQSLFSSHGKVSDPTSYVLQIPHSVTNEIEYAREKSSSAVKEERKCMVGKTTLSQLSIATKNAATLNKLSDKVNKRGKILKYRKNLAERNQGKSFHNLSGTWSPPGIDFQQYERQIAPSIACPFSVLGQEAQLQGANCLPFQCISNQYLAPSAYGNMDSQYPGMPLLPCAHSGEDGVHQPILSDYEVCPGNTNQINKFPDVSVKPLTMTPQEKIVKLRRRQQMQAMFAIQKQQMQFQDKVCGSGINSLLAEKRPQVNQNQQIDGANSETEENSSILHSRDQYSPLEQENRNTITIAIDEYSLEDTILRQLQDIIGKLDDKVRRCIQDSLFRLAQSAGLRKYSNGKSIANRNGRDEHDALAREQVNSHDRCAGTVDAETETNPIDRLVAHLLFHRPLERPGKSEIPSDTPNSTHIPSEPSTHLPSEQKTAGSVSLHKGCFPGSSDHGQNFSSQESENLFSIIEHQHRNPGINKPSTGALENALNNEPPDGEVTEVETPQ